MNEHVTIIGTGRADRAIFAGPSVNLMAGLLRNQSKEHVMETLGISANTWLKIKRGEPIRASTALILGRRLERLISQQKPIAAGGCSSASAVKASAIANSSRATSLCEAR
jgi:hypothetical protein